jgi:hypothetical protein
MKSSGAARRDRPGAAPLRAFPTERQIWREIFMDGRPPPAGDALNPTYLGHSVGRWAGDTLVIDVVGFNEGTWLDFSTLFAMVRLGLSPRSPSRTKYGVKVQ